MTDPEFADATYIEPITPEVVATIIERERPDAIITNEFSSAQSCARILRRSLTGAVRFVVTSRTGPNKSEIAGIDERPSSIGAAAADLLSNMLERRSRHEAAAQTSTLLAGRWVE